MVASFCIMNLALWIASGASARGTQPGQLPSTGQTGLTFKRLQFTPVLDGTANAAASPQTQLAPSSAGSSNLLLPGRQRVQHTQGRSASSASSPAAGRRLNEASKGSHTAKRAAQLEAMLALHMERSRPCEDAAAETDEFGMAEDDNLEVRCRRLEWDNMYTCRCCTNVWRCEISWSSEVAKPSA